MRIAAPLCRGVAVLTRSTLTVLLRDGLTPRASRRRKAVSRLKASSRRSDWRMAGEDSVRESSYTSSTRASSCASQRSWKSPGTTITASSLPVLHALGVVRRGLLDLNVRALQEVDERGRVLGPGHAHLARERPFLEARHELGHEHQDERPGDHRGDQHHERRAPVAKRVADLLQEDGEDTGDHGSCLRRAGQAHEGVLQVLAAGRRADGLRRARGGHRAARDDDDLVAQGGHLLHHVAREEHALAGLAQAPHRLAQAPRRHHVQPVGGLVEDHVGRVVHQRAGDGDLHALALGKAVGAAVEERPELEEPGQARGRLLDALARHAAQFAVVGDVLARGEPGVEPARVRERPDARAHRQRVARGVDAVHAHASRRSGRAAWRSCAGSSSCRRRWGRGGPSRARRRRRTTPGAPPRPSPKRLPRPSTAITAAPPPAGRRAGAAGARGRRRPATLRPPRARTSR